MTGSNTLFRKLGGRFDRFFTSFYERRHPGRLAQAFLGACQPLIRFSNISDKWNVRWFIPGWMKALQAPHVLPLPRSKKIFIFTTYRIQFTLDLVLAIFLAWRGHTVTIGYLPKLQSPSKPPLLPDHPSAKSWLSFAFADVARLSKGKIRLVDLTDVDPKADAPIDEAFVQRQAISDTVQTAMKETIFPLTDDTRYIFEYMSDLGRKAQRYAHLHFRSNQYDIGIIPNGATFETFHFCHVAGLYKIPVNTFEKFAFQRMRTVNHGRAVIQWDDLNHLWERREELGYLKPDVFREAMAASEHLMNQHKTNSKANWAWALQTAAPQTQDELMSQFPLLKGKQFVLVGTNVPYDAGYLQLQRLFPSMKEWLVKTVKFLLEETSLMIVMRAHPGEAAHYGGKERSPDTLLQAGLQSERLIVLPGEARVNTYALMEAAKFGVMFSSTVGLEFAMMGKAVLLGADPSYHGKGFTIDSENQTQYFENLKKLSMQEGACSISPELSNQARLFYFLFHFAWQHPYPYDKPAHILQRPPAELLRAPDVSRYIPVLDSMTLTQEEFTADMSRFLGAEQIMPRIRQTLQQTQKAALKPTLVEASAR